MEGARLFLELVDKPVSEGARLALAQLILDFGGHPSLRLSVERHGVMKSIAVFNGSDWVYSFVPAKEWILAYVRPPEVRKCLVSLDLLRGSFPDVYAIQPDHLTVRLRTHDDAQAYCALVLYRR